MCDHMVMPRVQVLVQLDTNLVERLDQIASALGTNRSDLLRRGARAIIEFEEMQSADAKLVVAYEQHPADPALVETARRLAAETASEW